MALNIFRDGTFTISLGNTCQSLTILIVKNFLMSSHNQPSFVFMSGPEQASTLQSPCHHGAALGPAAIAGPGSTWPVPQASSGCWHSPVLPIHPHVHSWLEEPGAQTMLCLTPGSKGASRHRGVPAGCRRQHTQCRKSATLCRKSWRQGCRYWKKRSMK